MKVKLYEDNAGMYHVSNGRTMWTAATFPGDREQAESAAREWAAGEWEPSQSDGWEPVRHKESAGMREVSAYPGRPGRPRVGAQVNIAIQPEVLARVDARAAAGGISRSEWIRRAVLAALA